ncbi:zinc-binding dehydrogenase [Mycolicibacterium brumae]|nr:zinc-binding dehydrogenase [Mycolicibacterium brumae]MCV7194238.1 zinc-binding dehydrogenase [Mycolicibacterium brumae]UWW10425.1 zinc-binding dehydrogenase [Mycolicibacterium brumae]
MKRRGDFGEVGFPAGMGQEVAGVVAADTPGGPAVGTRVAAMVDRGYAEYALARADAVLPLPDSVAFPTAAALWVQGLTAYQALTDAGGLTEGDTVLVHAAAGGVGTLATQLARLLGAATVIGTAGTPAKRDHVLAHGADLAVDYTDPNWAAAVRRATGGRGADLVLDSVGGTISRQTLDCVAPFGRIVTFGAASRTPADYPAMALMAGNLSVTGYALQGRLAHRERAVEALRRLIGFAADGRLRVAVTEYPLEAVAHAHRDLGDRRTVGKLVLRP